MLTENKLNYGALSRPTEDRQPKCCRRRHVAVRFAVAALLYTLLICLGSVATLAGPSESELKAAFIYNFANYVEWPNTAADAGGAFVIGVYGDNSFAEQLDQTVSGKTVGGRRVEVRRFSSTRDLKPCHILFISASEEGRTGRILSAVKDWRTLTVGEADRFARNGGIIGFFMDEKKVRFEINPDEARKSGLKISSKLLKLARVVRG